MAREGLVGLGGGGKEASDAAKKECTTATTITISISTAGYWSSSYKDEARALTCCKEALWIAAATITHRSMQGGLTRRFGILMLFDCCLATIDNCLADSLLTPSWSWICQYACKCLQSDRHRKRADCTASFGYVIAEDKEL